MKKLIIALGLGISLVGGSSALADGSHGHYYGHDSYYGGYRVHGEPGTHTYGYNPWADVFGAYEYGFGRHARGTARYYRRSTHHGYHYNRRHGWHSGTHYGHY